MPMRQAKLKRLIKYIFNKFINSISSWTQLILQRFAVHFKASRFIVDPNACLVHSLVFCGNFLHLGFDQMRPTNVHHLLQIETGHRCERVLEGTLLGQQDNALITRGLLENSYAIITQLKLKEIQKL